MCEARWMETMWSDVEFISDFRNAVKVGYCNGNFGHQNMNLVFKTQPKPTIVLIA
jgi:hypothetical protein